MLTYASACMSMKFWNGFVLVGSLVFTACASGGASDERGGEHSATVEVDRTGSCASAGGTFCGGASPDRCWCDGACQSFGDCCDDKVEVCDCQPAVCEAGACGQVDDTCGGVVDCGPCPGLALPAVGTVLPMVGSCNVSWAVLPNGQGCNYRHVDTTSGTSSPLLGTMTFVERDGQPSVIVQFSTIRPWSPGPLTYPTSVDFPTYGGAVEVPLALNGTGTQFSGSWVFDGGCGGNCSGSAIPAHAEHSIVVDAEGVRASVGGYLPSMPHPNGLCWANQSSLSCNFHQGTAP